MERWSERGFKGNRDEEEVIERIRVGTLLEGRGAKGRCRAPHQRKPHQSARISLASYIY